MKYILDSNTFIEAKNRYYSMTVCPAYWQWLLNAHGEGHIYSIDLVKDEMLKQHDELADWTRAHSDFFVDVSESKIQEKFAEVAAYVASLTHMRNGTHEDFMSGADPWLIAVALANDFTIVTQESLVSADVRKKIYIPNVCQALGAKYINTFELLHELEAEFVLSAA